LVQKFGDRKKDTRRKNGSQRLYGEEEVKKIRKNSGRQENTPYIHKGEERSLG